MTSFRISPEGAFSLEASTHFLEGFAPAAYDGSQTPRHLHLAFPVEGTWDTVGVCVRQTDKVVIGEVFGEVDQKIVRKQVARILSLDIDASGFAAIGRRDPVVHRLQRSYPGTNRTTRCAFLLHSILLRFPGRVTASDSWSGPLKEPRNRSSSLRSSASSSGTRPWATN